MLVKTLGGSLALSASTYFLTCFFEDADNVEGSASPKPKRSISIGLMPIPLSELSRTTECPVPDCPTNCISSSHLIFAFIALRNKKRKHDSTCGRASTSLLKAWSIPSLSCRRDAMIDRTIGSLGRLVILSRNCLALLCQETFCND